MIQSRPLFLLSIIIKSKSLPSLLAALISIRLSLTLTAFSKPVSGKKKLGILKTIKLALTVSGLNKDISKFEKMLKKQLGDDYPDMPRFKSSDFIK